MDKVIENVKLVLHPYYLFNIILSLSFISAKKIRPLCEILFNSSTTCDISNWESEILFFLIVIVMFRTRKSGNRSFLAYISMFAMYAKTCNVLLWFSLDPIKGVIYVVLVLVHLLTVGEPVYTGPENVLYFDGSGPEEEMRKDKDTHWLLTFYTSWNPDCARLAPIFSKLSLEYGLDNLKFGKIDVGRYPDLAKKYHINDTSFSLQLPTIALYKGDKEVMRRPCLDSKGKFHKFYFIEDNIRAAFDINNLYLSSKSKVSTPLSTRPKEE